MIDRLFVIRHGMRVDFEDPTWSMNSKRPWDPPLSVLGMEHAGQTGEYLKSRGIRRIYSSPFIRTVQTAEAIAARTGASIYLESGFMEFLFPAYIPWSPDFLTVEQLKEYGAHLDGRTRRQIPVTWPEGAEETWGPERAGRAVSNMDFEGEGSMAVVTHGAMVEATVKYLTRSETTGHTGLCAVNELHRAGSGWHLVAGGQGHLRNIEETLAFE